MDNVTRRVAYKAMKSLENFSDGLSGGMSAMMPNHHITKPVLIGEIQDDGQFDIVYETLGLKVGDAWSDFLPDSKDLIADWRAPMRCGNYNTATGKCGGSESES